VGALTAGEIGVLLSEASAADADAVVRRLRDHLAAVQGARAPVSIGVATRSAEWPAERSVVGAAREQARRECA
jgi:hypothetical protein